MALAISGSLIVPLSPPSSFPVKPCALTFPKLPLAPPRNPHSLISAASSSHDQPPPPFASEQAVLEALADMDATEKVLPAVRTFENDLAGLTLVGAVDFQQALTAAAADGGETANEHLSSGVAAMVVETLFPGAADDHSTVSTRLFLPANKVKEKAVKLKKALKKDMFQGATSKNILAMTFRQVVIEQLWSLELAIFGPGTERDMNDLENPREVPVLITLSSTDGRIISEIGEVICRAAIEGAQRHFPHDSSNRLSSWFNKRKRISSRDSSIVLYNFLEHEILANARVLLDKFNLERGKVKVKKGKLKNSWWTLPSFSKLEKIGGPEFCAWLSEYAPSYMLEIDASKFGDVKFEGWKQSEENRWEVILTHSQMVTLADILDMYYEDVFTLPNKRLSCHAVSKPTNLDFNKGSSLLKKLSIVLVSGIFLFTIGVLKKIYLPHQPARSSYIQKDSLAQLSDSSCVPLRPVESSELETCCISVIRKLKESLGWPEEIRTKSGGCAWVGELPEFPKEVDFSDPNIHDVSSTPPLAASEEARKELEDIASYQVVVSSDGNIIGFQPTNRVAVNNWAANPLTRELYGGKNLTPGFLEPGLKMSHPSRVVALELLISLNPASYFALVRAADISRES